jgi:hypothetical protein
MRVLYCAAYGAQTGVGVAGMFLVVALTVTGGWDAVPPLWMLATALALYVVSFVGGFVASWRWER